MSVAVADARSEPVTEPAIPACECYACRHPNAGNAEKRARHAAAHQGFTEWLAANRPEAWRKPSYAEMRRMVAEEAGPVESGACVDPLCHVTMAHPAHRA